MIDVAVVSHTHWDREWYLPFQEFRYRLVALVDQVLDTLTADPDFLYFTLDGQTIVLEDYLALRPQREAELKQHIQSGRLLVGPWFVMPDEFLVSGESLVRNLMLGRKIAERFGKRMNVGYVADTFGHSGQLPQILALCGIDSAVFRRGLADEPNEVWWEASDGTRVLAIYLRDGYDNAAWLPADLPGFIGAVRREVARLTPHSPTPHLLLMEGGDHIGLRLANLPTLIRAANEHLGDIQLRQATLPECIAAIRRDIQAPTSKLQLRIVRGELRSPKRHHLLSGVLSTRMWIKQRNDACETALTCYAEPLAAMGLLLGGRDLRQELWQSWHYLLENHTHDSISGCNIDEVLAEMQTRFSSSAQIAEMITAEGLETLARRVQTAMVSSSPKVAGPASPSAEPHNLPGLGLTVFNPTNGPRTDLVTFQAPKLAPGQTYRLVDSDGESVPISTGAWQMQLIAARDLDSMGLLGLLDQIERGWLDSRAVIDTRLQVGAKSAELDLSVMELGKPDMTALSQFAVELRRLVGMGEMALFRVLTWSAGQASASFIARNVPGFGYRTYWLTIGDSGDGSGVREHSRTQHIENEFLRVEANRRDGTLTLLDKRNGQRFRGLNRLQDGGDRGDEYNYCPPTQDRVVDRPIDPPSITIHDESPVGWRLEVAMRYEVPSRLTLKRKARSRRTVSIPIVTRVWLRPGVPRLDIETTVDNRAEDHRLRVLFPTPFHTTHSLAEGQFDLVVRGPHAEPDTADWIEQPAATAPQCAFVAVKEGERGLVLASRGLREYELIPDGDGATIALTLLRCIGWLSRDDLDCRTGPAGPSLPTPGAQCLGVHTFAYSLIPLTGSLAGAIHQAHAFRAPLRAVVAPPGDGRLPARLSFIELTPAELVISAIKPVDDGDGWIVRFWNIDHELVSARLTVGFDVASAGEVNLLEEQVKELEVDRSRSVGLTVRGKQIVSVRLIPSGRFILGEPRSRA